MDATSWQFPHRFVSPAHASICALFAFFILVILLYWAGGEMLAEYRTWSVQTQMHNLLMEVGGVGDVDRIWSDVRTQMHDLLREVGGWRRTVSTALFEVFLAEYRTWSTDGCGCIFSRTFFTAVSATIQETTKIFWPKNPSRAEKFVDPP